jgi:hypothetical protein
VPTNGTAEKGEKMTSTTGTAIETYIGWLRKELEKKDYGEVSISFVVSRGQVTDVRKTSMDWDHRALVAIQTPVKPV